ncbi:uncharacterized protein EHS24_000328 [Apiotrichum porosum]|uniref:Uncharacterized protein n=1 Tax=Apiotrichum porosum TaxID=105984 RepID=A0A427Y9I1_9TREE|nr:uncharacterized protein EHS24_000328 [Apiotrichum porosum]RSH87811.1 hypothetical protein EHS24_000328 [Apiotrichum porosum]
MAPSPTDHFDISAYKYACSRPGSPRRSDPTPPPLATRNLTYSHHHPLPMDAYSQRPYSAPALPSPPLWSPNIFYPLGALVWYAGSVWRCDSPHTSGALAREPTYSLHLWTPVGSSVVYGPGYGADQGSQPPYGQYNSLPERPSTAPVASSSDRARLNALREDAEAARNPAALRDELLGARTWRVGGVGVFSYAEDLEVERTRRAAWRDFTESSGRDAWLRAARARTAAYDRTESTGALRPVVRWHLVEGSAPLPRDVIPIGYEYDEQLYAARVWHERGMHVGKAGDHLAGRCEWSYGGGTCGPPENSVAFEVLCGDPSSTQWAAFGHGMSANIPGWQPVEGGRERDGRALFIGKANVENGVHVGKVQVDGDAANIGYGGFERIVRPFEVLTYESYQRR